MENSQHWFVEHRQVIFISLFTLSLLIEALLIFCFGRWLARTLSH